MIFLPFFIFIFGLLLGSFLNVVILRMNTGRSVVTGRSKCARCSRVLKWYELIPVFSFLGLRGKCSTCKNPISFQYPLIELTTAIGFLLLFMKIILPNFFSPMSWVAFVGAAIILCLLIVIVVYDLRHKIIPDTVVYPLIIMGVLSVLWQWLTLTGFSPGQAIVEGFLAGAPFFFLWFLSKGRMMGFGDVKLALAFGLIFGLGTAVASFFVAFWIGGLIGVVLLLLSKKYRLQSQIPFAPFLIAGMAIVYFCNLGLSSFFPII